MGEWSIYLVLIFLLGGLFFASAVYALYWAANNGQFKQFEKGAESIFTEEEPLGTQTDFFPGKSPRQATPPTASPTTPSN